ncbi:unannotated protein [freshwater metagenome]|uniref:Unannotated protein n=1 Tax=freshwater metagenome TaxID=449393 RepID=A0A6J7H765_9ZZZZ|nr:hypothetical protein [Actinomycetota bacterium]
MAWAPTHLAVRVDLTLPASTALHMLGGGTEQQAADVLDRALVAVPLRPHESALLLEVVYVHPDDDPTDQPATGVPTAHADQPPADPAR